MLAEVEATDEAPSGLISEVDLRLVDKPSLDKEIDKGEV